MPKETVKAIKKDAEDILGWDVVPTETDFEKREKAIRKYKQEMDDEDPAVLKPLLIMIDSSLLLSYDSKKDINYESAKVIVSYLQTQQKYFNLYLPNLVILEVISRLRQLYTPSEARSRFDQIVEEIGKNNVALSSQNLDFHTIFERYEHFSKKHLSSNLKSNDFIIATDGIVAEAIILTCDKKMYEMVKKTYKQVYFINNDPVSYTTFISSFEKEKLTRL